MKLWICKCNAPMDRPLGNSSYWRCAWCGMELDSWYPDESIGYKEVEVSNLSGFLKPSKDGFFQKAVYNGHLIEERPSTINNGAIIVVSDSPFELRSRKYAKGYTHHFAMPEVHDALLGEKPSFLKRIFILCKSLIEL
jgi:hypothetical protein